MPIVLVSVDSKNATLRDFQELTKKVDVLFEATTPEATKLADDVCTFVSFVSRVDTVHLNPLSEGETKADVVIRMQSVFNLIKSLNIGSAMIISHHSVLNTWRPDVIGDEWDIVEMI